MSTAVTRVPIPASDQTWLHMDRPNNLMHVHSLMWYAGTPTWSEVERILRERVIDRFPVFHRRPVEVDGHWMWEDDPAFDLRHHLRRESLPGSSDVAALRRYMAVRFAEPFDDDRPLWDMTVIEGVTGLADEPCTVTFSRFHHALADGIRLVQLMLTLCDVVDESALPPDVGRNGNHGLLASGADVVRRSAADALDVARGLGAGALRLPRAVAHLGPEAFEHGLDLLIHPTRLLDVVTAVTSEHNQSVNTVAGLAKLMVAGRSVDTSWSGTPGVAKQVSWVSDLDLAAIKAVGRRHQGTVNDVLLAVISRALTRYLGEKDALVDEIHWLVPVSLQPLDRNLPQDLGNHFSLVFAPMPLGIQDPGELLAAVRSRMTRLKESAEPVVTFGIQWLLAESPRQVAVSLTNFFANKGVGVLTNVPGPSSPMTFAGVPVLGALGWAPTSGDQPMSISIFSYNGQVSIGIAADARLVPDPDRIATLLAEEFTELTAS